MTTIFAKLAEAQKGFEKLYKNSKADRYKYADLPAVLDLIMPELHAQGLFLHQKTSTAENAVIVETVVYDSEGNSLSGGQLSMPTAGLMQKGAQAFGSALTYARRYSLTAFFCLSAEDDDGNIATRANVQAKQPPQPPQPAQKQQAPQNIGMTDKAIADFIMASKATKTIDELKALCKSVWGMASAQQKQLIQDVRKNEGQRLGEKQ